MTGNESPDGALERLINKALRLSGAAWETRITRPDIDRWLTNFTGLTGPVEEEKLHAIHLLTQFNYFGMMEMRVLLRSLFRDLFQYPILQQLRADNGGTQDSLLLTQKFAAELRMTRFIGMGNPSESGSHLLYYFRQENALPRDLFVHSHELLTAPMSDPSAEFVDRDLKRVVFIDDLLGSGQQALSYTSKLLTGLRDVSTRTAQPLQFLYYVLFAKPAGLAVARSARTEFDEVHAVHELDASQDAFAANSRVFAKAESFTDLARAKQLAQTYGASLFPGHALGYGDGQMMLGFHHNVPDNTLPIFWSTGSQTSWQPIFPRHAKEATW